MADSSLPIKQSLLLEMDIFSEEYDDEETVSISETVETLILPEPSIFPTKIVQPDENVPDNCSIDLMTMEMPIEEKAVEVEPVIAAKAEFSAYMRTTHKHKKSNGKYIKKTKLASLALEECSKTSSVKLPFEKTNSLLAISSDNVPKNFTKADRTFTSKNAKKLGTLRLTTQSKSSAFSTTKQHKSSKPDPQNTKNLKVTYAQPTTKVIKGQSNAQTKKISITGKVARQLHLSPLKLRLSMNDSSSDIRDLMRMDMTL